MKCPCCKGTGSVDKKILIEPQRKKEMVIEMRNLGFKFREIMEALNYKSPRSISKALNK